MRRQVSGKQIETAVRPIVKLLADGEYDAVVATCTTSQLSADDLRQVVTDYGCTFVELPEGPYPEMDVVRIDDTDLPSWSVWVPLWSVEEGRSDLTLMLTVERDGERWNVELDDLHVP